MREYTVECETRAGACKAACKYLYEMVTKKPVKKGLVDTIECSEKVFVVQRNGKCVAMFKYND